MASRHFLFVIDGASSPNIADLAMPPAATMGQNGKRIELTSDQWQFLRGLYAMNPEAPPGLPFGDNVVLAQDSGDSDDLLFFVEGDKPCAPMPAPPALLSLVGQVVMAESNQENLGGL